MLQQLYPLYVRIVDKEEIERNPEVHALFPPVLPNVIFELVGGNHRAFVHGAWWYDLVYCANSLLIFL